MSVDLARGLLFVAAYGNDSVAIVDLNTHRFLRSITGLSSPQGVAWVPGSDRLYVSNAGDGTVDVYNGSSFAPSDKIALSGDADNLRYAAGSGLLYVGYGSGGIAAIDTTTDAIASSKALTAHPESFQVEDAGPAVYVNVPQSNLITAFDKATGVSILNRSMTGSNFPMALDEAGARLFVATRDPPELRILDTSTPSLRSVANLTIAGDPDDIFFDSAHRLVYVSCGQGTLEVVREIDPDRYALVQTIATGQGARTSLLVPELGAMFVAVPSSAGQQPQILEYRVVSAAVSSTTSTVFSSTALVPANASLSVSPDSGPSGLLVTLTGSGYVPGARYQVCVGVFGGTNCGLEYTSAGYLTSIDQFAIMGGFVASQGGNIPSGTEMAVPDLFGGNYSLGVALDGRNSTFVSSPFTVESPSLSADVATVTAGKSVTLAGRGYAPSTTYTVCLVLTVSLDCGYSGDREEVFPGLQLGNFTADANGSIPSGTRVTIPTNPPLTGEYSVGVFVPSGGFIMISLTQLTVTRPP